MASGRAERDAMGSLPLTTEQIRVRRAERRAQVRRRRATVLVVAAGLVALGVGILAGRGETGGTNRVQTPTAESTRSQPARTTVSAPQSRLGNGKPVTLAFGGDIHFETPIRERLAADPASVLASIAPVLRRADVAVVNLETAVTDRSSRVAKEYTFRAPASAFEALKAGGVDVASVANNHGMDFGVSGLRDTLAAANRANVRVIGAGIDDRQAYAPYRVTIDGQRLAIIGATQVLDDHLIDAWSASPGDPGLASAKNVTRLVRAVRDARATSDTVVVFLHWGAELETCPTPRQRRLARTLASAGADVIVGAHAHVLLGAGRLGSAFVAYGLGNLVFYASREATSQTGVLEVTVTGRRVDGYRFVPARISGGLPYPLAGSERTSAIADWRALRRCTGLRP